MKKILLSLLFIITLGFSAEVDLIAIATNGALNEQSEGVKVLSDEEMREVVGGYRPFTVSWYGYTFIQQPLMNNYNANKNPQTTNQAILSNAFMNSYRPFRR